MLNSAPPRRFVSCFVSAPTGLALGVLPQVLVDRGIEWEWAKTSASELANPYDGIRMADFFIGVMNGTRGDYRVVHETGAAAALEKPILLVMSQLRKLPIDLSRFPVARVKLDDERALRFHVDAFLSAPERNVFERRTTPILPVPEPPSVPPPTSGRTTSPEAALEREVFNLIERAGGSAIVQPDVGEGDRYRPDLLIWLGSLEPELLDPAVVELKEQVEPRGVRGIEERLLRFMSTTGVRTGLVVTLKPVPARSQSTWPGIFWLDLQTFRELVETARLGPYLRESRNRAAHGVR